MGATKKLFEEFREKINTLVNGVVNEEINPFELGRELSYTKNCIEYAKEQISEYEKNEFDKYSGAELKDMKIKISGGGYTYKYDHIEEWSKKKDELKVIEDNAKTAFTKQLSNLTFFDNDTGEEIIPAKGIGRKTSISYG